MKKIILFIVSLVFLLTLEGCSAKPVTFEDKDFELGVRKEINKPSGEITTKDLKSIKKLSIDDEEGKNIESIKGIEYMTSLEVFGINDSQLSNIEPLSNLNSLEKLIIDNNQINNIEPLSKLKSLKSLWIFDNNITDISPLTELDKLYLLRISQNPITDISPLLRMDNLKGVTLPPNQDQAVIKQLKDKEVKVDTYKSKYD